MNRQGMENRKRRTLACVPLYPESVSGATIKTRLQYQGHCSEVTNDIGLWWNWLAKLKKEHLIFQTKDSHYSRPRTPADLQYAYTRTLPRRVPPGTTLASQIAEANAKLLEELS